jgi:hypothetical protein
MIKLVSSQDEFNIHKSISTIQYISRIKDDNYRTISINAEKVFDKIEHPLEKF